MQERVGPSLLSRSTVHVYILQLAVQTVQMNWICRLGRYLMVVLVCYSGGWWCQCARAVLPLPVFMLHLQHLQTHQKDTGWPENQLMLIRSVKQWLSAESEKLLYM